MKLRKYTKNLGLILLAAASWFYTSCSKEFLETELTGAATEDVYYSTIDGLSELLTGTYAGLNVCAAGLHNLDVMYLAFGSMASDEAEAGGEMGGGDILDFQYWDQGNPELGGNRDITENHWGYNYKVIFRANQVLHGIRYYKETHSDIPADSAALLSRFEGEAIFLRAFVHFNMTQIYGRIPVIDHVLSSTEFKINNDTTSVAVALHFVQEELLKAIDLLPEKSEYSAADVGRATKGAAQALLAKAYLYESSYAENYAGDTRFSGCTDKYAEALAMAEEVINSSQYSLVGINGETFDTYWNQNGSTIYPTGTPGYRYIFTVDGELSDEIIWSVQSANDGLNYMLSRGTYLTIYTTVRNLGSGAGLGWGFNCPTEKLRDAYTAGDLRKMVAVGETGDPVYINDVWDALDCRQSPTNLIGRKYEASPEQYWTSRSADGNGPNNFPYIRYADVILMAAEAALKTGADGKALDYVNQVRLRARNGASTGEPAALSSVTIELIKNERLLELALEGHRFFDLVRWKNSDEMIGQEIQTWLNGNQQDAPYVNEFSPGVNEFFPIPTEEIISAGGDLLQNPGYQ
ncbi:MAG: RagB/SusD family nutrient uptake outer membrane protein [Bacteroidales bacterium]|nr:RagB/SusD family nutrient uptake outer membrane protein [Bacteroidales bacterium]